MNNRFFGDLLAFKPPQKRLRPPFLLKTADIPNVGAPVQPTSSCIILDRSFTDSRGKSWLRSQSEHSERLLGRLVCENMSVQLAEFSPVFSTETRTKTPFIGGAPSRMLCCLKLSDTDRFRAIDSKLVCHYPPCNQNLVIPPENNRCPLFGTASLSL